MEEDYKDLDRYQDILGQLPMLQVYSHILYVFPLPIETPREIIVGKLERAITKVRDEVPWMGARVVNYGKGPGNSGIYRVIACPRPTEAIVVRDVSTLVPSYSELSKRKAPLSIIDAKLLTPVSAFPERFEDKDEDPAHTVRIQASFIEGGVVLDFVMHHNMADAGGHFGFVNLIARAMRGEEFPPKLLEQANCDRRHLFPLLGPDEALLDHSHHKQHPITTAASLSSSGNGPKPEPAQHHIFRVSAAKLRELKKMAEPVAERDSDVRFISTDDALSAFIWQRLTVVRARRGVLPPSTRARFGRAIDGRGAVGVSRDYMGDLIHNVTAFLTWEELVSLPLSSIAAHLRRELNKANTAYHVRSFATFVAREADKSTITYGGQFNPATDLGCSSIRGRSDLFADFGQLGFPTLIRRPPPPPFPGLLVLFPGTMSGDCDAMLCITDADLEDLKRDPLWADAVEYIVPNILSSIMVAFSSAAAVQALLGLSNGKNLTQLFGPGLSPEARVILPDTPIWPTDVQQRWSTYHAPTFRGAILPATISDIQHTVRTARANDIPFIAVGGGHGTSGYEQFDGISIDLGNFKSIEVNKTANTVTIGAATKYSALSDALFSIGKELPYAACPCVGVIGATLGAGISPMQGVRGLMIDALLSVQLITAEGDLITVSSTEHPDLFWGLRGAGANFGIVVEATYRMYDLTNHGEVTVIDLVFPASANQSFFRTLHAYDDALPAELAMTAVGVYNREIQQPVLVIHALYFGPAEEGTQQLKHFFDLQPIVQNVVTVLQTQAFPPDHGSCQPNQRINVYTIALRQVHPPTFEEFYYHMVDLWRRYPDYDGRLLVQRYSPASNGDSVAYPWRDAIAQMNIESFYTDPSHDKAIDRVVKAGRDRFGATSGFCSLRTYMNYAHGDEGPAAWYSEGKLSKLSALKGYWDPEQLFSWHNPVPLAAGEL
ncbi:hypothetical protein S7711_09361 [Stachybotrys chartarum IBT 7711]|uniref:FAD-binding PCMH-type domain-containing protein n=1 Tax=Stachybotrys chartarum (strain CBS 109288 / IBT 7711) TaxID=1280523 RepID=A0A084AYK8_STACB|nr:hypothetical protein S7711_09361 [Stachybotrys chartarum IBT 7711]